MHDGSREVKLFPGLSLILLAAPHLFGELKSGSFFEVTVKISLEDGAPLNSSPIIDLHVAGSEESCVGFQDFANGTVRLQVPPLVLRGVTQSGCQISVILSGYKRFTGYVRDGSVVTLRRNGPNEDSSVSALSLAVPASAKKEYASGEGAASKNKWALAESHFQRAISQYPQYSMAWSELGQAMQEQGNWDGAKASFNKARELDPAYIKPIVQLAAVGSLQHQWQDEMNFSEEALKLHPVDFPAVYYYHAEAVFHLGKLDDSERLTREALQLDPGVICPESLVLLGSIFEKQGNAHDAAIEYKNYLELAPKGLKAAEAKQALARLRN